MSDLFWEHSQHKGERAIMSRKCSECYKEFHAPTLNNPVSKFYTRPSRDVSMNDREVILSNRNPLE